MSKESTQPAPPRASLSPELDPSGFTERAPTLASLLPDEALAEALSRGDAFALHRALTARFAREAPGPLRDTLRELLDNRGLFIVSELPPKLGSLLGTGARLVGLPSEEKQQTPFIATRAVCLFGLPLWPLGEHLVQRGRDGELQVIGRVAAGSASLSKRWGGRLALGVLGLAGAGAALAPYVVREVQIANGFSRPVEVLLDGERLQIEPGQLVQQQVFSFGAPYEVEARWPGAQKPFEVRSVESHQRTLYNILDAASLVIEPGEQVLLRGGWESRLRAYAEAGEWQAASKLAKAVFLADPSQLQAGQEAARLLVQTQPQEALVFARELPPAFPDDAAIGQLAQDVLIALDERPMAFSRYELLTRAAPDSVVRALLAARAAPPEQAREAYASVLKRFPESPEAMRALARIHLADGYPQKALKLLETALSKGPESLEDLELRMRAMVSEEEFRGAFLAAKQFHGQPRHASFELAVLAGRLARMAGPTRSQYLARELLPPTARSAEHLMAFALLTDSTLSNAELSSVADPVAREALALTNAVFKDFEAAVKTAATTGGHVLSRLDPETAAVLALELSRRGEQEAAHRVFGSSLALLAARAPLVAYVSTGTVQPGFPLLPPGLQAAAYQIRARAVPQNKLVEEAYARWADSLGGMARRALGPKEPDLVFRKEDPNEKYRRAFRYAHVNLRYDPPPPPPPPPLTPAPVREGARLPRPWPAPLQ